MALLDLIIRRAVELVGAESGSVYLWDEAAQFLVPRAWYGLGDWMGQVRFRQGEGIPGIVAQRREGMLVNDYRTSNYVLPLLLERTGITAAIAEPLVYRDRLVGVITINNERTGQPFLEPDRQILALFAAQAAIAIENARLFAQVSRAKAEWEQTFDSISDLVALIDSEYRLTRVNRALARRLQTSPKALVGQPCYAVLHGRHGPWPECPHARTLLTGRPITQEVEEPHLGGIFLVTTSPLWNAEGQLLGSVHIARDITEQKRLETEVRQRERFEDLSRAKSAFIATMSHEFRSPLNSIIGFAELLREQQAGPLTEKQARYLGHIHQSGRHLLALIGDILDLSKIEAGKIVLEPRPLSVAATLDDLLVLVRGLATKKGQRIQAELAPDLPPLRADPVRFKQILFNLLSNAVKFSPKEGLITVTARRVEGLPDQMVASGKPVDHSTTRPIDAHGEWLELCVADTGIGIKAEDLPRLFKEFVQLEATQAQKHEGTGLGLALTKQLVELHGGRIWAASAGEGRGSTFTAVLPFSGPEALAEASGVIANPVRAVASIGGRPDDRMSGERTAP